MSLTEILDQLYEAIESEGIDLHDFSIYDEEDLQTFALNYLMSHLEDAFEEIIDEEEEELVAL
jgi:hypothetical protein